MLQGGCADACYHLRGRALLSGSPLQCYRRNGKKPQIIRTFPASALIHRKISWRAGRAAYRRSCFFGYPIPGELSGMALAKKIRQHDQTVSIVFVTNYADYVYEGYVVNALRYLKKPICREDIYDCMEIAYRHFSLLF